MLYHAFASQTGLIPWLLVAGCITLVAYLVSRKGLS